MKELKNRFAGEAGNWRAWVWLVGELFTLYSAIRAFGGPISDVLLCILTALGLGIPYLLRRAWGYQMSDALFVLCFVYILGSMAARVYKLYYLLSHWDKLLHLLGGIVFALIGSYLMVLLNRDCRQQRLLRILFAVCFSIAISVLWEFYEYGMDRFFGTDMQRDTVVQSIYSYNLGDEPGVVGEIADIESVTINDVLLEGGYLDLGLIDTMGDMLIETAGALLYAGVFAIDRGRHPAFTKIARRDDSVGPDAKAPSPEKEQPDPDSGKTY